MIVINGLKNIYTNLREDERELAVKTIISAVQPTWTCDVAEPYSVYLYNNNIDIDWFIYIDRNFDLRITVELDLKEMKGKMDFGVKNIVIQHQHLPWPDFPIMELDTEISFKPDNQLHWNLVRQYLQQLERMVKNEKK
jgi:hypothetical protein